MLILYVGRGQHIVTGTRLTEYMSVSSCHHIVGAPGRVSCTAAGSTAQAIVSCHLLHPFHLKMHPNSLTNRESMRTPFHGVSMSVCTLTRKLTDQCTTTQTPMNHISILCSKNRSNYVSLLSFYTHLSLVGSFPFSITTATKQQDPRDG